MKQNIFQIKKLCRLFGSIYIFVFFAYAENANLITHPSFESDECWEAARTGIPPSFADDAHTGDRCVNLSMDNDTIKYNMVRLSTQNDHALILKPNQKYEIELWAKTVSADGGDGRIRVNFWGASKECDFPWKEIKPKADGEWRKYNLVIETKEYPEGSELFLRIWTLLTKQETYIDDVILQIAEAEKANTVLIKENNQQGMGAASVHAGLQNIIKSFPGQSFAQSKSFLQFSYLPANLIDGNVNTSWVSSELQDAVIIGIGSGKGCAIPHLISGIKIFFGGRDRAPCDYSIKVSRDMIQWETVAVRKNMPYVSERLEYFQPVSGWFVMLDIENTYGLFGASLREIEIYSGDHQQAQYTLDGGAGKYLHKPDNHITMFRTEKMMYSTNQAIKAQAEFGPTDGRKNRSIKLFKTSGIDQWQFLIEKRLSDNQREMIFDVATEQKEFAHALKLILFENGKEIQSKMCIFEVCTDWAKILRPCAVAAYEVFSPGYPETAITKWIEKAREYFFNTIEFYMGAPAYGTLAPDTNTWVVQPHYGKADITTYNRWRQILDQNGIKRMHYWETLSALEWNTKKEWFAYTPVKLTPEEQIWTMWKPRMEDQKNDPQYGFGTVGRRILGYSIAYAPNLSVPAYVAYMADQYSRAVKLFDFDAMFLDDFTRTMVLSSRCSDTNGNSATDKTPDEVAAHLLSALTVSAGKVSRKKPVFVGNNLIMGLEGMYQKPDFRKKVINGEVKSPFPSFKNMNMVWVHENVMEQMEDRKKKNLLNYPYNYRDTAVMIQGIRQVIGCKPLIWWNLRFGSVINVKVMHAVVLANGGGYCGLEIMGMENSAIDQAVKDYLFFAVRYEEFLNPIDIKWLPDGVFKCAVPDRVLWKDLCFEKNISAARKQYYLHLINLPGREYNKKYDSVENIKNIAIEILIPDGWQTAGIHFLSPDLAVESKIIDFKTKAEKIHCVIPELQVWDFIIVDLDKT